MATEAFEILYDNTTSGLVATNVQDVVDELYTAIQNLQSPVATSIAYDNSNSGYPASDIQGVIDYMAARQISLRASIAAHNKTLYIDNSRTDSYTETGSITYPFKSIAAAISSSASGDTLLLTNSTYIENVVLPDGVGIFGGGIYQTIVNGYIWTGTIECQLANFEALGELKINGPCDMKDLYLRDSVTVATGAIGSAMHNVDIEMLADGIALTVEDYLSMNFCTITAKNSSAIVVKSSGTLNYSIGATFNDSDANETIIGETGSCVRLNFIGATNSGTADSINIDNGATLANANVLSQVLSNNDIKCGNSVTIQEGAYAFSNTISGTGFLKRPASGISFTPTADLSSTEVQSAIEEAYSSCKQGTDSPPTYTPAKSPELYYNTNSNVLYIHNGTVWYKAGFTVA
jgi:hypothetical protein